MNTPDKPLPSFQRRYAPDGTNWIATALRASQ
jgi:hypothetical protein